MVDSVPLFLGHMSIAINEKLGLLPLDDKVGGQVSEQDNRLRGGESESIKAKFASNSRFALYSGCSRWKLLAAPIDHSLVGIVNDDGQAIFPSPSEIGSALNSVEDYRAIAVYQSSKVTSFGFCHAGNQRDRAVRQEMIGKPIAPDSQLVSSKLNRTPVPIGQLFSKFADWGTRIEFSNYSVFGFCIVGATSHREGVYRSMATEATTR